MYLLIIGRVQLEGTSNAILLDLLHMFAHGTWSEYKCKSLISVTITLSLLYIVASYLLDSFISYCLLSLELIIIYFLVLPSNQISICLNK